MLNQKRMFEYLLFQRKKKRLFKNLNVKNKDAKKFYSNHWSLNSEHNNRRILYIYIKETLKKGTIQAFCALFSSIK
jgi:hypothetical protein